MGRFYKTTTPTFEDFASKIPEELLYKTAEKVDTGISNMKAGALSLSSELDNIPSREEDSEAKKEILKNLKDKLKNSISKINSDPANWRKHQQDLISLQQEISNEYRSGKLSKIKKEYDKYTEGLKSMQAVIDDKTNKFTPTQKKIAAALVKKEKENYKGYEIGSSGFGALMDVDLSKSLMDAMKAMKADKSSTNKVLQNAFGTLESGEDYSGLSRSKIINALLNHTLTDPNLSSTYMQYKELLPEWGSDIYTKDKKLNPNNALVQLVNGLANVGTYSDTKTDNIPKPIYDDTGKLTDVTGAKFNFGVETETQINILNERINHAEAEAKRYRGLGKEDIALKLEADAKRMTEDMEGIIDDAKINIYNEGQKKKAFGGIVESFAPGGTIEEPPTRTRKLSTFSPGVLIDNNLLDSLKEVDGATTTSTTPTYNSSKDSLENVYNEDLKLPVNYQQTNIPLANVNTVNSLKELNANLTHSDPMVRANAYKELNNNKTFFTKILKELASDNRFKGSRANDVKNNAEVIYDLFESAATDRKDFFRTQEGLDRYGLKENQIKEIVKGYTPKQIEYALNMISENYKLPYNENGEMIIPYDVVEDIKKKTPSLTNTMTTDSILAMKTGHPEFLLNTDKINEPSFSNIIKSFATKASDKVEDDLTLAMTAVGKHDYLKNQTTKREYYINTDNQSGQFANFERTKDVIFANILNKENIFKAYPLVEKQLKISLKPIILDSPQIEEEGIDSNKPYSNFNAVEIKKYLKDNGKTFKDIFNIKKIGVGNKGMNIIVSPKEDLPREVRKYLPDTEQFMLVGDDEFSRDISSNLMDDLGIIKENTKKKIIELYSQGRIEEAKNLVADTVKMNKEIETIGLWKEISNVDNLISTFNFTYDKETGNVVTEPGQERLHREYFNSANYLPGFDVPQKSMPVDVIIKTLPHGKFTFIIKNPDNPNDSIMPFELKETKPNSGEWYVDELETLPIFNNNVELAKGIKKYSENYVKYRSILNLKK